MRRVAVVLVGATFLAIAWPQVPLVSAAPATVTSVMPSAAANKGGRAPIRFNMLAATWTDKKIDEVSFRTSMDGSTWSAWQGLDAEDGEGPDGDQPEGKRQKPGRATGLAWVGDARFVQTRGLPAGKIDLINVNGNADDPGLVLQAARAVGRWAQGSAQAYAAGAGPWGIYTRAQWGANESVREQTSPSYSPTAKMALIHHTDTGNSYTAAEVPGIIRGIYYYHVRSRDYRDIAYNFLVDRFGRMWEGRYGGMDKPVVGGHTAGFNYETIGVAMIGDFTSTTPTSSMRSGVARVLSWKFAVHRIRPRAVARMTARSSPAGGVRWKPGTVVSLNTISAHRDVNTTACNGTYGYKMLNWVRYNVWVRLPPPGAYVSDLKTVYLLTPYGRLAAPYHTVWRTNVPEQEVLRLTSEEMNWYKVLGWMPLRDGMLVRGVRPPDPPPSPDPTASPDPSPSTPAAAVTYFTWRGTLRPFNNETDIATMGFNPATVEDWPGSILSKYPVGDAIDPAHYPDGMLLRSPAASVPYVMQGGKRFAVLPVVFPSWNFSNDEIVDIPANVMSSIPFGGHLLFRDGSLVKSSGGYNQTIFVISRGQRRPIASSYVFSLLGYKTSNIRLARDSVLNLHPLGPVLDGRGP